MRGAGRYSALQALMMYPGGLQLGGGITADNAVGYLEAGASHVIVTSYVFRDGRLDQERLANLVQTLTHAFSTPYAGCSAWLENRRIFFILHIPVFTIIPLC